MPAPEPKQDKNGPEQPPQQKAGGPDVRAQGLLTGRVPTTCTPGMQSSSKSRSKRESAGGAHHQHRWRADVAAHRRNALKHGAFAIDPTIPGEDSQEFTELYAALIIEWQPSGPTEADAVFSLADLMWRKRRAQKMLRASLATNNCRPSDPMFDERRSFNYFIDCMRSVPETAFERYASRLLTAHSISHLKQKFPRSNYQSTSEWAEAVIGEIKSVLLPAAAPSLEATEPGEGELTGPLRQSVVEAMVAASILSEKELFDNELNLRERLEGMIDRKVKHLIQLKANKQMFRQISATCKDEQPKRTAARSGLQ